MILRPLKNIVDDVQGQVTGTGWILTDSRIFGGACISADGTNSGTVTVRKNSPDGDIIFDWCGKQPDFITAPFHTEVLVCYYEIIGENCSAQFFGWVP